MNRLLKVILAMTSIIGIIWLALEPIALRYLNKELNAIEGYEGYVRDVDIYLLSGGIQIDSLVLNVSEDEFTKPFVELPSTYASLQWSALFRGRFVGEVDVLNPELSYEIEPSNQEDNVNEKLNWVEIVKDIGMITLNRCEIRNGQLNYLDRSGDEDVSLFINDLNVLGKNLATVVDETNELPSKIDLSGQSIGNGRLAMKAKANLLKQVPDFDLEFSFEHVDLTALNEAFNEYARVDVEEGEFDFYTEVALKDSTLSGYFKPIIRDIKIIDWDEREKNPLRAAWEGIVGLISKPIENNAVDQIASKVPVEGTIVQVEGGVWTSIYTLFKNAFFDPLSREVDGTIDFDDVSNQ